MGQYSNHLTHWPGRFVLLAMLSLDSVILVFCLISLLADLWGLSGVGEWAGCAAVWLKVFRGPSISSSIFFVSQWPFPYWHSGLKSDWWTVVCCFHWADALWGLSFISHRPAWSLLWFWWLWNTTSLSHPHPGPHPAVHHGVVPYGPLLAMGSLKVPTKALSVLPCCSALLFGLECTMLAQVSALIFKNHEMQVWGHNSSLCFLNYSNLFSLSGLNLGKRKIGTCVSARPFSYFLNTPGRSGRFSSLEPESLA